MGKNSFRIAACVLTVIIGALVWLNVQQDGRTAWDVCCEMTNQRVEWTGAGYSGIYGRRGN